MTWKIRGPGRVGGAILRGETAPLSGTTAPAALNSAAIKDELVADFGIASPRVSVITFGINILDGVYGRVLAK